MPLWTIITRAESGGSAEVYCIEGFSVRGGPSTQKMRIEKEKKDEHRNENQRDA